MKLLLVSALVLQAQVVLREGNWEVSAQRDAITDSQEVSAVLKSPSGELAFLCSLGRRSVLMVQPRGFLGGGLSRYELRDTWVRFDSAPAAMSSWKYVDSYATPYSFNDVLALLRRMENASTMTVRLTAFDRSTVDVTFELAGTGAAIAEARRRC